MALTCGIGGWWVTLLALSLEQLVASKGRCEVEELWVVEHELGCRFVIW